MQVDIMIWFQGLFENFQEFFDVFFTIITAFGEELILFIVLPIFYWAINKEASHLVAMAGFASLTLNGVIKDIAQVERPISNPNIRFVEIDNILVNTVNLQEGSYSFPSGHSQTISVLTFSLASYYNKKNVWIFASIITLLVMMSRLYLGVHWPLDVLVGALLGILSAVVCYQIFKRYNADARIKIYLIMAVICLFALFFAKKSDTFKSVGACFGFAIGALFERKFVNFNPKEGSLKRKILRCALGLVLVGGLKFALKPLFALIAESVVLDFLRYMIIVFVAIALYPMLFKKIKL